MQQLFLPDQIREREAATHLSVKSIHLVAHLGRCVRPLRFHFAVYQPHRRWWHSPGQLAAEKGHFVSKMSCYLN